MTVIQYPSAHASDPLLTYAVTVLYLIPVLFQLRGRAIDVGGLVKEGGANRVLHASPQKSMDGHIKTHCHLSPAKKSMTVRGHTYQGPPLSVSASHSSDDPQSQAVPIHHVQYQYPKQ
jgi:hypothetical protein